MMTSPQSSILRTLLFLFILLALHASAQTTTVISTGTTSVSAVPSHEPSSGPHPSTISPVSSEIPTTTSKDADGPICTGEYGAPYCQIDGNSDFYGLGVRLGVYFSWVTSWIANNFLPEEMGGSFDTNSIFLLAIAITSIYYSIKYELFVIDALILLQLSFGFMFSVMSLWGYRTMYYRKEGLEGQKYFGGWGTHFRLLLMGAISVFAMWFWTEGLNDGLPKCNLRQACGGLKTFMFAEVDLFGPIRTVYAIGAGACCLFYGIMILAAIVAGVNSIVRRIANRKSQWELQTLDLSDHGLNRNEFTVANIAMTTFNFLWMIFAALSVEFTLNFNHVNGVLATSDTSFGAGQLLPAFIGVFSFIRILYLLFREYVLKSGEKKDSEDLHGLGMTGTTAATSSPDTPSRKSTFAGAGRQRKPRNFAHRLITAWLPWLNAIEWWRGDEHTFELLSEGRTVPVTPDMELLRRRVVKNQGVDGSPDDDEETAYQGRGP